MKAHLQLIASRLVHLGKLRTYLTHATGKVTTRGLADKSLSSFSLDDSNDLAAFRMRVSEFQEHLGKLLASIAREEEVEFCGFSDVLAYAEKIGIIASETEWREIREIRNQINHEYEDDPEALGEIIKAMVSCIPALLEWHDHARNYCSRKFGLHEGTS
ncbi:hypothetical protein [Ferriphaselus sp. R-1]|uniref:hypothetical protein n=1 Tax=Ferriphaselus sp. R-1 TaxID=1485544 RepID=UPI000690F2D3|nr:hypothetical protein [Ferriphaselus sp. R-1]